MYDIFISCKSEDYSDAKQIYEFLSNENYSVFLADRELRKLGSGEFGEAIDAALESAQHLIVFTSNPKYLETGYVKSEWRTFIEEKRSGRKSGNLLTILKNVHTNDLPIALRHFQSFDYKDYQLSILNYVGGKKNVAAKSRKNLSEFELYLELAEKGNADVQKKIGDIYKYGKDGVTEDCAEAVKWYRKAAEQGNAEAQYNLGIAYLRGNGVNEDLSEAEKWFLKAAEQGDLWAQIHLGDLYYHYDINKSLGWYSKADEKGLGVATFRLARYFVNVEEYDKARELYRKIYKDTKKDEWVMYGGLDCDLPFQIGELYEKGEGRDESEARKFYRLSVKEGWREEAIMKLCKLRLEYSVFLSLVFAAITLVLWTITGIFEIKGDVMQQCVLSPESLRDFLPWLLWWILQLVVSGLGKK